LLASVEGVAEAAGWVIERSEAVSTEVISTLSRPFAVSERKKEADATPLDYCFSAVSRVPSFSAVSRAPSSLRPIHHTQTSSNLQQCTGVALGRGVEYERENSRGAVYFADLRQWPKERREGREVGGCMAEAAAAGSSMLWRGLNSAQRKENKVIKRIPSTTQCPSP
jgi:hypothetical protein